MVPHAMRIEIEKNFMHSALIKSGTAVCVLRCFLVTTVLAKHTYFGFSWFSAV